jgi:hypothetical protein
MKKEAVYSAPEVVVVEATHNLGTPLLDAMFNEQLSSAMEAVIDETEGEFAEVELLVCGCGYGPDVCVKRQRTIRTTAGVAKRMGRGDWTGITAAQKGFVEDHGIEDPGPLLSNPSWGTPDVPETYTPNSRWEDDDVWDDGDDDDGGGW